MKVEHVQLPAFTECFSVKMEPVDAPVAVNKCALSFILGSSAHFGFGFEPQLPTPSPTTTSPLKRKWTHASSNPGIRKALCFSKTKDASSTNGTIAPANVSTALPRKGSKFCSFDGCTNRSKMNKRCWRHGGSVKCKVADCDNRAKSKGVCWSHGGGTVCSVERCSTISVSKGFCWTHGGGKRCLKADCIKPAYQRTQNYCASHFKERSSRNDIQA